VTGNPVRPEILAVDRSDAGRAAGRAALGLPDGRVVIGVTGGSLGARRVNEAVRGLASLWAARSDVAIHHAVGRRDWSTFSADLPAPPADPAAALHYRAVAYEDRMELVLAAADLFVGRSGGSTAAELTAVGLPGVLVPLPGAPGDHQTANARGLERLGAVVVVPDPTCTTEHLAEVLGVLVDDAGRRAAMATASAAVGRRDAADAVAALVEAHARSTGPQR